MVLQRWFPLRPETICERWTPESSFRSPSLRKRLVLTVRRSPLDPRKGVIAAGPLRLRCALGKGGTSIFKREGDGASPVARMAVLSAWRRPGRIAVPNLALPSRVATRVDGWCDAPLHGAYNRPVRLPFPASCETMVRADRLYDLVLVLDWNVRERRRSRGRAIFLHLARAGYRPTEGCVAVSRADMIRLAPLLRAGARVDIRR